jgi:hypothetical protein
MGKRKRVVVDMGILGEKITDVVEGPRNAPIRIRSWEEYVKHFGGIETTLEAWKSVRAYFNEAKRKVIMTRVVKKDRTVGDVIRSADQQGLALDFRFVPLTEAEKSKGSKRLEAEVFGTVLEQLGLLSEDEMKEIKSKVTKQELIEELTFARKEIAKLRTQVEELLREEPLGVRVAKAARLIAEQFARSAAKRCPKDTDAQQRENASAVEGVLYRVAHGYRIVAVVAGHGMLDGPDEVTQVVAGALGDLLADQDLCRIVDRARETNARQVAMTHGAADSLAMARRLGAGDRVVSGEEIPLRS